MRLLSPSTCSHKTVTLLLGATLLAGSWIPITLAENISLPEIGDPAGNILTPMQERRLGEAFMRNIRSTMQVMSDPLTNAYLQSLGERLASHSDAAGRPFSFFLVDHPAINAFAGPGGYIGVYSGLILATKSESELASVLAHEIAHITQKHLVRSFDATSRMSLPAAAVLIAGIVLGAATDNSQVGIATAAGVQAGMLQKQINFTRANEMEADRVGIQILSEANFNPRAMPVFFSRMGKAARLYDSQQLPEFLRTHPVSTNRIADSRGRAESHPYRQHPDSTEYHLLHATLRERQIEDPKEAVRMFRATLTDGRYRNQQGERYGYLHALMRARNFPEAENQLNQLLQKDPQQIAYLVARAELLKQTSRPENALQVLEDGLAFHPGNGVLGIHYANMLLDLGQADKALQIMEDQALSHPQDAQFFRRLARAAGDTGQKNLGHQYLAQYYYLSGEPEAAVQQLEIALRNQRISDYRSAQMAARLKTIKQEIADLKEQQ